MKAHFGSFFALLLVAACAQESAPPTAASDPLTGATHDDMGPVAFRDIFARYARDEGRSESEVRRLIYLPTPELIDPGIPLAPTAEQTLLAYDGVSRATSPSDVFTLGSRVSFAPPRDVDDAMGRRGGVTFVVIGDGLSEIAATAPFQDILSRTDSAAATQWRSALAAASTADATDDTFALRSLSTGPASLGDLVSVASIDHGGMPLARIIVLRTQPGSLESAGSLEAIAPVLERRIDKVFHVLGTPSRFYLLGHGRGAALALDVALRARSDGMAHPWGPNVGGVISLGGTVQGSPLADAATSPSTPAGRVYARLGQLASDLRGCDGADTDAQRSLSVGANATTWTKAMSDLDASLASLTNHAQLSWEGFAAVTPESGRYARRLAAFATQSGTTLADGASQCDDIRRYKAAWSALSAGVITETTSARHAWWQTHVVPISMKLVAIGGTMGDAAQSPTVTSTLITSSLADSVSLIDTKSARQDYYDIEQSMLITLNDGFVPLDRARFWPRLMTQENTEQGPVRDFFLGVFGASHAALAHPEVVVTNAASGSTNAFPRALMIQSLARFTFEADVRDP